MYVDDDFLSANRTSISVKQVGIGVGGGHTVIKTARAVPFNRLRDDALIDTSDLCRIFGCSGRTVYRWVADYSLRPVGKIGREFLFTKREVVRWFNANRPVSGRPPVVGT